MSTTVDQINFGSGKRVFARVYCHVSALAEKEPIVQALVDAAAQIVGIAPVSDFNVVRFERDSQSIGLLLYQDFFTSAFPSLSKSWKVDLATNRFAIRSYDDSFNPPILHRKELMLAEGHPQREHFETLTDQLEALGLFEDPVRIGLKLQWETLLHEHGYRIVGHQLVPIGNTEFPAADYWALDTPIEIARHLTALSRQKFSAPIQILGRMGFLDGSKSIFDYGCGKGDDVRGLNANGIAAIGWDPYFAPETQISEADIVNLGFVINVIEDPVTRREALRRAFALARELLVVSTMLVTENPGKVRFFGDGVLTSRNTFQKYYTQNELRDYLADTLGMEPISVAPGVFFVFRDREAEQKFQIGRYRSRIRIHPVVRTHRSTQNAETRVARRGTAELQEANQELLDALWAQCLDLGREPDVSEIENRETLERLFGSSRKALRVCLSRNEVSLLAKAGVQRTNDLVVYLALQQFQKRKPYKQLDARLQRDVRVFFGDYASAQEHGRRLLYQSARPEVLDQACQAAAEQGLGWFEPSQSLQLHTSLVQRLPPELRVYIGCAAVLFGDIPEADLVKIHIRSSKVSFLRFDTFMEAPLPRLLERTKVNLRTLDLDIFAYGGEYPSPLLYLKSRYINEELPHYSEQAAFDEQIQSFGFLDLTGYGPSEGEFARSMNKARWRVEGFKLARDSNEPNLDEACGKTFTYRQLIECGETQRSTKLPNLPRNPESYAALHDLATYILDPVVEYFGAIELTYGFCSAELARRVPGRNAPKLDQHAAAEKTRLGVPICPRSGAAVDFLVRDESMREVADWIIANLPFDRLYFYGDDRPLHVSYGPQSQREAIHMRLTERELRVPSSYK